MGGGFRTGDTAPVSIGGAMRGDAFDPEIRGHASSRMLK